MKTLINKANPQIRITAPEIEEITALGYTNYEIEQEGTFPLLFNPKDWTLVNEEPKHTEVWVESRTIFEQDANTFVNTEGEPEVKLTGWVARDSKYDPYFGLGLVLFKKKPERTCDYWSGEIASQLPWELFPDLKLEDEPMEVEITIRRK